MLQRSLCYCCLIIFLSNKSSQHWKNVKPFCLHNFLRHHFPEMWKFQGSPWFKPSFLPGSHCYPLSSPFCCRQVQCLSLLYVFHLHIFFHVTLKPSYFFLSFFLIRCVLISSLCCDIKLWIHFKADSNFFSSFCIQVSIGSAVYCFLHCFLFI